jgi:hypothetical protein
MRGNPASPAPTPLAGFALPAAAPERSSRMSTWTAYDDDPHRPPIASARAFFYPHSALALLPPPLVPLQLPEEANH